jgi:uncharacterized protein (DUF4415 family)
MAKKKAAKKTEQTHGGAREGAGRPVKEDKKTLLCMRLPADVVEWINETGPTQAAAVTHAVRTCPDFKKPTGN